MCKLFAWVPLVTDKLCHSCQNSSRCEGVQNGMKQVLRTVDVAVAHLKVQ
jgi:hypothetical protein